MNIEICQKKCNGCGACYNICPSNAITMKSNDEGFLYPVIDKEKCTDCGACYSHCSLNYQNQNDKPVCYANMANDEIRLNSSSGGCFSLLANYFLSNNGYVCGAVYDKDFSVKHIIINSKDDLVKLMTSKYLQSDIGDVYKEIYKLLKSDNKVFFVGTPCQVAGLKSFLKTDYKNLYTADLICNGTPSYKIFKKYLKDNCSNKKIKNINFRDKKYGWGYNFNFKVGFTDGTIFEKPFNDCSYLTAFNDGLSLRNSCYSCKFQTIPRNGDLTLGDFWEVDSIQKGLNDKKGTSLVLVNNSRGEELLENIKINSVLLEKTCSDDIYNIQARLKYPIEAHPQREMFFKNLDNTNFDKNVKECFNHKYDAMILNFWWANNYGATLTAFALQKLLIDLGYSSLLVKYIFSQNSDVYYNKMSDKFARKYLKTTKLYHTEESLKELNNYTDKFIVGSDQVFRYEYAKDSFFLNFVDLNKVKLAFSASFGISNFNCGKKQFKKYNYLLSRFDNISTRELSGINLCKNMFNINVKQIIDPVFALKKSEYDELIKNSELKEKEFIFSYILDNSSEIREKIRNFAKNKGLKIIECNKNYSIEDWLYLIKNAKYVLTDSFHGACFSVIYNKNFLCLMNKDRGKDRFETIISILGLSNKNFANKTMFLKEKDIPYINYNEINIKIKKYADICKNELSLIMQIQNTKNIEDIKKDKKELKKICKKKFKLKIFLKKTLYKILSNITTGKFKNKFNSKYKKYKEREMQL